MPRTLLLPPDTAVQLALGPSRRSVALRSPSRFSGLMELEQAALVSASWSGLTPAAYGYLAAFWRAHSGRHPRRFLVDLPKGGAGPTSHVAMFDGTLRVGSVTGNSADTSVDLRVMEVAPAHPGTSAAADLIALVASEV